MRQIYNERQYEAAEASLKWKKARLMTVAQMGIVRL